MPTKQRSDLIIVGASAAGISAAIYASRRGLNCLVISQDIGGEVATSGLIENYLGFTSIEGMALTNIFRQHLEQNRVPIELSVTAQRVEGLDSGFQIDGQTSRGNKTWLAATVIIATGARPRELGVPGEHEFRGKGVTYCTTCDGPLFRGKEVVVIGGGNSAIESGLMLSDLAKRVTIITKNASLMGEQVLIEKLLSKPNVQVIANGLTEAIIGQSAVTGLRYQNQKTGQAHTLSAQGVFIHVGLIPNSQLCASAAKNKAGEIIVNTSGETSVPGLFAAGDVTDTPFKQIVVAAGQGAIAALTAARYLNSLPSKP